MYIIIDIKTLNINLAFLIAVDEYTSNPCLINGTCMDLVNGFKCGCLPGFNGTRCEVGRDKCQTAVFFLSFGNLKAVGGKTKTFIHKKKNNPTKYSNLISNWRMRIQMKKEKLKKR